MLLYIIICLFIALGIKADYPLAWFANWMVCISITPLLGIPFCYYFWNT